ncbi:MAG: hypothetical protein A3J79_11295 [Elusimicrobia bacterium RIFOXYB2_FULL_62_6]|nr:MAG: hypothetical protein A3J79_11295 [Elusimicrobia bacterium RIFOXYB2_FULL_62_6]
MKRLIFLSLFTVLPACAGALELSLEENRGESGTIGYVDIDRVFKEFSGTLGAREEFINDIKKKEEAISQRKTGIYTLKADIAKLRQEKEFALTLPGLLKTREQLAEEEAYLKSKIVDINSAAASVQALQDAAQAQAAVSTAAVTASTDTAAVAASTDTAGLPGMPPAEAVQPQPALPPPPAERLPGIGIDMPGISRVPTSYFKFSVSTAIPEIDAAIAAKERELKDKEDALKLYQRQAEVELLQYESHKSELILGRIYLALKELAIKEEVSVIVDKRSILFGHSAVDLTGKLLKKLEEGPL